MSIGGGLPAHPHPVGIATRIRRSSVERVALWAGVGGLVFAGVALRLVRLGERSLSFDEAYTLATAQRSFLDMFATFRFEANGTLYAALLWPLLRISEDEAVSRAPAVVAGLATIPAVYWAGRTFVGRSAALVAAGLVAVSPATIGWSVYGRGYAPAILFAVLSFGCLARALRESARTGRWRAFYVLATLAMAYSSVLATVTLLPVQALMVAAHIRNGNGLRPWTRAALALVVGSLPLLFLLYVESTYRDPLAWLWEPDFALVRRVGGELAAGPAFFGDAGAGLAFAILATVIGIVVGGVIVSRSRPPLPRWSSYALLAWAFFPPLLLYVASQVRPTFWGRYLGITIPALALLLAVLLARMPRLLAAFYGALLALLLLTASLLTPAPPNDFRALGAWVEAQRSPGEPLVVYPIEQLPAAAYYARSLRVEGVLPVEEWNDTPLPAELVGYRRDYDWGDSPIGPPTESDLARLTFRTGSVLVLTYPNLADEIPLDWAGERSCDVEWARFDGLTALSIRACEAPSG